jgi:uncharacterized protein YndB with AHSA1/START domain
MTTNKNVAFAKAEMLIRRPVSEVFEAFINPEITAKFWFTKGSGRLEPGQQVKWTWEMYNFTETILVKTIEPNERIVIEWGGAEERTSVEWTFKQLDTNSTFVSIINGDFSGELEKLISQTRDSTEGFTLVLAGLKAYLEHHIELNLVGDRFPTGLAG